jgi:hypothetical protein
MAISASTSQNRQLQVGRGSPRGTRHPRSLHIWLSRSMRAHSVRVGDTIDFDIEDIVPFGVETGEPVRFQGMFQSDLTMAEAKRSRINAF